MSIIARVVHKIRFMMFSQSGYANYLRKQGAKIGTNCEIYKSANFGSEPYLIEIGNHVRINSGVQLITHDGGVWVLRQKYSWAKDIDCFGKIKIEDNVHIGTNAVIMPGVTIGANSIVGCAAVVTHDVPDNSIVAGVPARKIETLEQYVVKMREYGVMTKSLTPREKRSYLEDNKTWKAGAKS